MKFDLHMHSNYSTDGEFTPKELIQMALDKEIGVVALSDHNLMSGIDEMMEEGRKVGIKVIPAIECDTKFEGYEVHVLAYNIEYKNAYFRNLQKVTSKVLCASTKARLEAYEDYFGITLDIDRLIALAGDTGLLADVITDILDDPRYMHVEAFKPFRINGGKESPRVANFYWEFSFKGAPCYIDVAYPSLKDTVQEIHKAGGIAVLAHPWRTFYQREDLLKIAMEDGIDGIEAYSNYHDMEQNVYYETFCKEHGLVMTCGSDFHGKTKADIQLGEYGYNKDDSEEVLQAFLQVIGE